MIQEHNRIPPHASRHLEGVDPARDGSGSIRTAKGPVLIPIDFEDGSRAALDYAARLAGDTGRQICVMHVMPPSTFAHDINTAMVSGDDDEAGKAARAALEEFATPLLDAGIKPSFLVRTGKIPHEISAAAQELDAALIVMRTRGLEGSRRWFTRHTAEHIVGLAPCPVLSVRRRFLHESEPAPAPEDASARLVLVPVDLSPSSAQSVRYAACLAQQSHVEVMLLRVVRMPAPSYRSDAVFPDQVPDHLRQSADRELAAWVARQAPQPFAYNTAIRFSYHPAETVVSFAEKLNPQLIIITPEKRSWLGRVLKGSVTRKLIRHVRSPVLCLNHSETRPSEPEFQTSEPSASRRFRSVFPLF